ncbi:RNA 2',3'-cyclic phosphodiesterase [Paraburkholderia sp.]|uniref:RNA 2',3'-cyclic phosphodiesterase n=1 Tax=Paraburkholderia sp. TaxID=1926495 RepID=UPI002F3FC588
MRATETSGMEGWQRCFIALAPDTATRDALAALPVALSARRVPYDQLHLTVAFIGSLTLAQGGALAAALAGRSVPLTPTRVLSIEHWPGAARPRLTVATLAMSDEFATLDGAVRSLMVEQGLPVDARAFRPHITLARFGRDAAAVDHARQPPENLLASFESLILYSSTLARHGARYQALATTALR